VTVVFAVGVPCVVAPVVVVALLVVVGPVVPVEVEMIGVVEVRVAATGALGFGLGTVMELEQEVCVDEPLFVHAVA
jgi:hypothetical protein